MRGATRTTVAVAVTAAFACFGLSACMTGERATIDTSVSTDSTLVTSDSAPRITGPSGPATAATLALLFGQATDAPETATFEIRPTGSTESVQATVARDSTRTVVTIRDLQYRSDASGPRTCRISTQVCTQGFNSQPLSDLNITAQFWGPSVRQELRSPTLAARIGPIRTTQEIIAGQPATCVDVPGPQVTDRYCALASGLLAQKTTARVTIELGSYNETFDESAWAEFADR